MTALRVGVCEARRAHWWKCFVLQVGEVVALRVTTQERQIVYKWILQWEQQAGLQDSSELQVLKHRASAVLDKGYKAMAKARRRAKPVGQRLPKNNSVRVSTFHPGYHHKFMKQTIFHVVLPSTSSQHKRLTAFRCMRKMSDWTTYSISVNWQQNSAPWVGTFFVCSETKSCHEMVELQQDTFTHVCFGIGLPATPAGVAVVLHAQHRLKITDAKIWSTKVMHIDVHVGLQRFRIVAAYAPRAGHPNDEFQIFFDQLHRVVDGPYRIFGHQVVIGTSIYKLMWDNVVLCLRISVQSLVCLLPTITTTSTLTTICGQLISLHALFISVSLCLVVFHAKWLGSWFRSQNSFFEFQIAKHEVGKTSTETQNQTWLETGFWRHWNPSTVPSDVR